MGIGSTPDKMDGGRQVDHGVRSGGAAASGCGRFSLTMVAAFRPCSNLPRALKVRMHQERKFIYLRYLLT